MTGQKKKLSATAKKKLQVRLDTLKRKQAIYVQRGHEVTPVDGAIAELEDKLAGGQSKPSEVKKDGTRKQ